jgi:hypothetical protein
MNRVHSGTVPVVSLRFSFSMEKVILLRLSSSDIGPFVHWYVVLKQKNRLGQVFWFIKN